MAATTSHTAPRTPAHSLLGDVLSLWTAQAANRLSALDMVAAYLCDLVRRNRRNTAGGGGDCLFDAFRAILSHLGPDSNLVWPGVKCVAEESNVSISTVRRALEKLRAEIGHPLSVKQLADGPGPHNYKPEEHVARETRLFGGVRKGRNRRSVRTYDLGPLLAKLPRDLVEMLKVYFASLKGERRSAAPAPATRAATAGSKEGQPAPVDDDWDVLDPTNASDENSNHSLESALTTGQASSVCNVPINLETPPAGAERINKTGEPANQSEKRAAPATAPKVFLGPYLNPNAPKEPQAQQYVSSALPPPPDAKITLPEGTGPGWAALCKLLNKKGIAMSSNEAAKIVDKHGERCAYLIAWLSKRAERGKKLRLGGVEYAIGISRKWEPGQPELVDKDADAAKKLRDDDATYRALCEAETKGVAWHRVDAAPPKKTEPKRAPLPERANLEENPAWLALSPPQRERIALEAQSNVLADVGHAQRPIVQKRGIKHPRVQARILELLTENGSSE